MGRRGRRSCILCAQVCVRSPKVQSAEGHRVLLRALGLSAWCDDDGVMMTSRMRSISTRILAPMKLIKTMMIMIIMQPIETVVMTMGVQNVMSMTTTMTQHVFSAINCLTGKCPLEAAYKNKIIPDVRVLLQSHHPQVAANCPLALSLQRCATSSGTRSKARSAMLTSQMRPDVMTCISASLLSRLCEQPLAWGRSSRRVKFLTPRTSRRSLKRARPRAGCVGSYVHVVRQAGPLSLAGQGGG